MAQKFDKLREVKPVHGKIYRTARDESFMVWGVRPSCIFVEFADGRFKQISHQEWRTLAPNPAPC